MRPNSAVSSRLGKNLARNSRTPMAMSKNFVDELPLPLHRDRLVRAADVENGVLPPHVVEAVDHVLGQVDPGDGVGPHARAVVPLEENEGRPALHFSNLHAERLKERRGPHDGVQQVCPVRTGQLPFQQELGALEVQQRLADTDGAEQHEVRRPRVADQVDEVQRGLVVHRVALRPVSRPGRQAAHGSLNPALDPADGLPELGRVAHVHLQ
eukprot:scaffold214_cov249-Pinguiococcus_pyrenoidosus.AAC.7